MPGIDLTPYTVDGILMLGNVEETASKPAFILAADNLLYICKARWLNPNEPYTPANEILGGFLCEYLGLPIPRFKIVRYLGENYFGSQYHQVFPFNPETMGLPHGKILANIFAFDVWVCNTDRHLKNFLSVQTLGDQVSLMVIDHGRAFFGEAQDDKVWAEKCSRRNVSDFVRAAGIYREYIKTFDDFQEMLQRIREFPEQKLRYYIDAVFYLTPGERDLLFESLVSRRAIVGELLFENRAVFGLS